MQSKHIVLIAIVLILIALPLASFIAAASSPTVQFEANTFTQFDTEEDAEATEEATEETETSDEETDGNAESDADETSTNEETEEDDPQGIEILILLAGLAGIAVAGGVMALRSRSNSDS